MKLLIDVNQLLWNGPILVMLFGTHVYFTLRLRLVQRKIGYGISLSLSDGSKNKKGFGRFGSLTTTLAATLGTGNIIGISTRRFLRRTRVLCFGAGSPGFWAWQPLTPKRFCATISAIRDTVDPCIFFIFYCTKKRLHFFTVPPSRYLHFLSDAPHKATQ